MEILSFLAGAAAVALGFVLAKWPEIRRAPEIKKPEEKEPAKPVPEEPVQAEKPSFDVDEAFAKFFGAPVEQVQNFFKYAGRKQGGEEK